jgi:hypothetical protein
VDATWWPAPRWRANREVSTLRDQVVPMPRRAQAVSECERCHSPVSVPFGYEEPDHGLCWPCASDEVSQLRARIAELEKAGDALCGRHGMREEILQMLMEMDREFAYVPLIEVVDAIRARKP